MALKIKSGIIPRVRKHLLTFCLHGQIAELRAERAPQAVPARPAARRGCRSRRSLSSSCCYRGRSSRTFFPSSNPVFRS